MFWGVKLQKIFDILFLGFTTHIQDVCVFTAPIFSGLTAIATYFLTKEIWTPGAGLFSAAFISIAPGYISRSVAGSFDNEGIAIFALQCSFFLWIRAMKTGSVFWGVMTAFCYFYMVSAWGGSVLFFNIYFQKHFIFFKKYFYFLILINKIFLFL